MNNSIMKKIDELKVLVAHGYIQGIKKALPHQKGLHESEFKVFSQFGDDGIIQYLVHLLDIKENSFIEFGVENYTESNTRFLLVHDNWRGLIIDGSEKHILSIKQDDIYWRHDLTAVCSFVSKENINQIIHNAGFSGPIGLLSIDIDGNDYWIWDCITVCDPIIVIVEYNSVFGNMHAITVPYNTQFDRTQAHFSNLYWGCSLKALIMLAEKKGYSFVGCNSNGNNAYFIRNDKLGPLKVLSAEEGYVESRFRESRAADGSLTFISGEDRLKVIESMYVFNLANNSIVRIKELNK